MPPGVGLSSIEATCVQEQRRSQPVAIQIQHGRRDERSHPPLPSKYALHLVPLDRLGDRNLDHHIEHSIAGSIRFANLAQGWSQSCSCLESLDDRIRQGEAHLWLCPGGSPFACLIGGAKSKIATLCFHIETQPIG